ncbi:MAG: ABC transporter ATP-binding protein, partial [Treponema sp.]|nr:ABC transporter ATP-binding protein [Treponema sp.]
MGLEISGLEFAYKKEMVLRGVSFSADYGELVCLLGGNGAGKTTLFRNILGFLRAYRGTIYIDGEDSKTLSPRSLAQKIAYIPQSHAQTFNYSVLLTVMMGLNPAINSIRGPLPSQEALARQALVTLGIERLADRGFAEISGGERQLTLIARALVQNSRLLVMDEPTANLDYGNQIRVMKKIQEIAKSGYLVIESTHNPEHAFFFADRVIVLKDGRVYADGKPSEALDAACLETIYHIPVEVPALNLPDRTVRVCVPR